MENFEFCVPTNVIFGKGQIERLPEAVGAFGKKVLLAVGGGSVIDCCKAIASAYYYDGDAWDMIASHAEIAQALPIVTVLTIAATGSEADFGAVITNPEANEKLGLNSPALFPRVSIMEPTYTFTVPAKQTAAGSRIARTTRWTAPTTGAAHWEPTRTPPSTCTTTSARTRPWEPCRGTTASPSAPCATDAPA